VSRVVITAAADMDAAAIFDDLYAKAGRTTVVKYRASFKKLYENSGEFPDSGPPRPKSGGKFALASFLPTS
jgi:plasmid stabilization system protein ParE